ncbi:type I-B CRISPR-associated protein Cas7/Cst2/DevR [Pectinatus brassicae]|uniref:CRISPR-associated protein Cst2 n=1 Tax=Pectinatus brassicae TaxID=862415 RepID=A0A840UQN6_9FIRM|nr:type I-B CRISPR-associated protein Cas7/Cst2/DevR [Pectinatus brassicae]MBB5337028.1 CRISPR-associated protein Cst2 [Pectinatus brassicae]
MKKNGLTATLIIEAESANYSEGMGNIAVLKKLSRADRKEYTYISRQALRYNLMKNAKWDNTPVVASGSGSKKVVQFAPEATIKDYPEIDLFGYLKTIAKTDTEKGGSNKRAAVVRLSNAIAMEAYNDDFDYMTNMGLADRITTEKNINSIAQSEIHKSFYTYTITIDLDKIGIDEKIEIDNSEKASRVKTFLDGVQFLYRDIKGRRENMNPIFAIGGVYNRKNPYFENRLKFDFKNHLAVDCLIELMQDDDVKENTAVGCLSGVLANEKELKEKLTTDTISMFFTKLKTEVDAYYE